MLKSSAAVAALGLVVLSGCANQPPAQPAAPRVRATINTTPPVCLDTKACERMWLDAQRTLETLTGMRLRTVTDSRLETFAPTRPGNTGATVLKYPRTEGGYELRMDMECYRGVDCGDIRPLGINAFNKLVGGPRP